MNFFADQSFVSSLVVAISPGATSSCSGFCADLRSPALGGSAVVSPPSLLAFAGVRCIHHAAIRHTATTLVAERINHEGGIRDIENPFGSRFWSTDSGAMGPLDSFLGDTPGIFGSAGLNGLLFIPSPAAGFPEGISRLNREQLKRKTGRRPGVNA